MWRSLVTLAGAVGVTWPGRKPDWNGFRRGEMENIQISNYQGMVQAPLGEPQDPSINSWDHKYVHSYSFMQVQWNLQRCVMIVS